MVTLPPIEQGKLMFVVVQLVYMAIVIAMRAFVVAEDSSMVDTQVCTDQALIIDGYHNPCREAQVTYRVGWALATMLLLWSIVSIAGFGHFAAAFGGISSMLIGLGLFAIYLFIPDVVFNVLAYVSIPLVILAVVLGPLLIINAGAKIHNWISWRTSSKVVVTAIAVVIILISLVWIVFLSLNTVVTLSPGVKGKRQGMVIGVSALMMVLLVVSLMPQVKHGSILVSAMMLAYVTSLCWGATLNHSYDVNSMTYIDPTAYLVCVAFWIGVMCTAAGMEDKESRVAVTMQQWSRMTVSEVNVLVNDTQTTSKIGKSGPTMNKFRATFFFLFQAAVPLTYMHLISPNPAFKMKTANYHDGHFWFYVTAIIITMVLFVIYLFVPQVLKSRMEPSSVNVREGSKVSTGTVNWEFQKNLERVTNENAVKGLRVVRGREWAHSDQDGGEGKVGTLESQLQVGWWMVEWDNGVVHAYRNEHLSVAPKGSDDSASVRRRSRTSN